MSIYLSNSSFNEEIRETQSVLTHDANFHEKVFSEQNIIAQRILARAELSCEGRLFASNSTFTVSKADELILRQNSYAINAIAKSFLFGYESQIEKASSPTLILTDCTVKNLRCSSSLQLMSSKVLEKIIAEKGSRACINQCQIDGLFYCYATKAIIKDSNIHTLILPQGAKPPEVINSTISRTVFKKS